MTYKMRKPRPLVDRFMDFLPDQRDPGECWEWTGSLLGSEYGRIRIEPTPEIGGCDGAPFAPAPVVSHWLFIGPVPEGQVVRHTCDNPPCVNPAHLLTGTQADNIRDRDQRGRTSRGEQLPQSVVTEAIVAEIRSRHAAGDTINAVACEFGLHKSTARDIIRRHTWSDLE